MTDFPTTDLLPIPSFSIEGTGSIPQSNSDGGKSIEEILAAFQGPIPPVRASLLYRLGFLLVAIVMVLLPLIYVGLIGLTAYGVYWYATENTHLITEHLNRGKLITYFGPIFCGSILVLFMIKPIFAKKTRVHNSVTLDPAKEPDLFAFVYRLCEVVGAPRPARIEVDCDVNASAGFRPGLIGFLKGDLVLRIGLPLIQHLTLQEFSGVLAHELGHFSQRAAMRVTYLVRHIDYWFSRVVYENDSWDSWLARIYPYFAFFFGIVPLLSRFLIWLTRWILCILMYIGHLVSCFLLRQEEFNADLHEIRLAGSPTFESTFTKLNRLGLGFQTVLENIFITRQENRFSDDLARLVASQANTLSPKVLSDFEEESASQKRGFFDTHPLTSHRIARAKRENAQGVFTFDGSPLSLFRNYAGIARLASLFFYRTALELEVESSHLIPTDHILQTHNRAREAWEAVTEYFRDVFDSLCPLTFDESSLTCPSDFDAEARRLVATRKEMLETAESARKVRERIVELEGLVLQLRIGQVAVQCGNTIDSKYQKEFGLESKKPVALENRITQMRNEQAGLRPTIERFTERSRSRLLSALRLLHNENVRKAFEGTSPEIAEIESLLALAVALGRLDASIMRLRETDLILRVIYNPLQQNPKNKVLSETFQTRIRSARREMDSLHTLLNIYPAPAFFGEKRDSENVAERIAGRAVQDSDEEFLKRMDQAPDNYDTLCRGLLGHLACLALKVEAAIGLPPLPPVPPSEKKRDGEE
jgi:Zn-dependent protease with chaperone function